MKITIQILFFFRGLTDPGHATSAITRPAAVQRAQVDRHFLRHSREKKKKKFKIKKKF